MVKTIGYWKRKMEVCKRLITPSERRPCEDKVRTDYRRELSGRVSNLGDDVHGFMSKLDSKNIPKYKNKSLKEVANEFGVVEDSKTFK